MVMKVLVIDDDAEVRESLKQYLEDCSYDVLEAADGLQGIRILEEQRPDVALVDLRMPSMDGLELLREAKQRDIDIPIIVVSGTGEIQDAVESVRTGAWDFVTKPIHDMAVLEHTIHKALERREFLKEREQYQQRLEEEVQFRTEELVHANERLKSEVSERLCTELELKEAMEDVKAANTAKNRFLSNMSHELRTPLNSIIGLTDMVLAGDDAKTMEYIRLVNIAGRELMSILDNLLDLSSIESGKVDLRESDFSLTKTIQELVDGFTPQASWKQLVLRASIAKEVPGTLRGDESRVRQILSNLLINAIKNTDKGEVELLVTADGNGTPNTAGQLRLNFMVRVKAAGMVASFSGNRDDLMIRSGGDGLGLTISKELIVKMGGDIWVEDNGGSENTIHFTALFKVVEADATAEKKLKSTLPAIQGIERPLSILVAEDDPINQKLTEHFFDNMGHKVTVVNNGNAVLEVLARKPFDIILMDIQMPDMDGLTATKAIRDGKAGDGNRAIPIVAMTAHAMKGDRDRFLKAGLDDYLAKPVDLDALVKAIENTVNQERGLLNMADMPD